MTTMLAQLPDCLPPLRNDLQLHESAPHGDGSPSWTIHDPVNNSFYRIGWLEFELLSRWHLGSPTTLLDAAQAAGPLFPTTDELKALLGFLHDNQLLALHTPQYTDHLLAMHRRGQLSRTAWLLHHYLFFRIPLWHPERWLQASLPYVNWVFRRRTASAVLLVALLGLILTLRQIDSFTAAFSASFSPAGLAGYLLALAVAKALHELGHAFTATRYGVRVAHMGVAFLVLWPMLYTDTAESWRLRDRHQRLAIAVAGIVSELALAACATLAWALSEPGDFRQAMFFLAATSWLLSLGLNASPFMRFDGYFILSDLLDLPNLHERSFALARVWLRRHLLGWRDPDPEAFSPPRRRALIGFALATWTYRLVLFLGIAALVYTFFFKLLGIFLFLVEIGWFVIRPVWNEAKIWQQRRDDILPARRRRILLAGGGVLLAALIPWDTAVDAPGWLHGEHAHVLYSPTPARVAAWHATAGDNVAENVPIITLEQPESRMRANVASAAETALQHRLAGLAALPDGEENRQALEEQQAMRRAQATGEAEEAARLQLRAPVAGRLMDVDDAIAPGAWVSPHQPLATVVAPHNWVADAFVGQHDLERIAIGNPVRFYAEDNPLSPWRGEVVDIDRQRLAVLPHALLSARHGGMLAVLQDERGTTPRDALYRVRIRMHEPPDRPAVRRGTLAIAASPRSWLLDMLQTVLIVFIREASF